MVDLEVRTGMLEQAAGDERVGCVLLDVVLGFASHPDPAGGLADADPARLRARDRDRPRVRDPRRPAGLATARPATLSDAGAIVAPSNAAAARLALRALR